MRSGGERGIRTLGRALRPYGGLANRWLQPLTHLSVLNRNAQNALLAEMISVRANSTRLRTLQA